ncbi:MAG: N-6 DNA methylase [Enterococcus sp.]|nr:N-6 DNA methylase [Enterococcus sp.]
MFNHHVCVPDMAIQIMSPSGNGAIVKEINEEKRYIVTAGRQSNSTTKSWCTPLNIIESVKAVFGGVIDLDPCSNEFSQVKATTEYMLPSADGLKESWAYSHIYVNPPYGSDPVRKTRISHWFDKIVEAYRNGSEVITLVPVATNTGHWKNSVYPVATAICFLSAPRLKFSINGVEDSKGAPMACAVIYYGKHMNRFAQEFSKHGVVIPLAEAILPLPS